MPVINGERVVRQKDGLSTEIEKYFLFKSEIPTEPGKQKSIIERRIEVDKKQYFRRLESSNLTFDQDGSDSSLPSNLLVSRTETTPILTRPPVDVHQIKACAHAAKLFCYSFLFIFLILSCKKKGVEKLDDVEQIETDSTSLSGKGGIYYNDDIVSTPPKDTVYKFTIFKGRVGMRMDPDSYVYTIGVLGYRPSWSFNMTPDNYTYMGIGLPSEEVHPLKHVREYVHTFEFYRPVNEEFTLTSIIKINALNLTVSRSTKIKIEVVEKNIDVIRSNFGMSREEVKKVEKDELNVPDSEFLQVNPDLILKSLLFDSQLGPTNFLAFAFKDNKLVSVTGINKYASDLSVFNDVAEYFGYESTVSGLTPVKWQKNGLQFTLQMKEVHIGITEKKTAPCYVIEKVP